MARLPREPTLLQKKFRQVKGFKALAAHAFEDVVPSASNIQRCLFHYIRRSFCRFGPLLKFQPQETVGSQSKSVRLALDRWELHIPEHLDRHQTFLLSQVEIDRLGKAREVGDAKHLFVVRRPEIRKHLAVRRIEELYAATPEHAE